MIVGGRRYPPGVSSGTAHDPGPVPDVYARPSRVEVLHYRLYALTLRERFGLLLEAAAYDPGLFERLLATRAR